MRCPENQYLSEIASICKSCFWNFCNFVCLADFPVYCPFSQQSTWFWIFFLFVVFCIFESFVCLEDISVYSWFWNFRVFGRCPCLLFLPATTALVRLVFVFVICCSKDFVYFWNFCVFGRLACLDFPVYCLNPRQPANVVTWWTNKRKLASTWIYIFCAQSNFGHETGRDMQKCISKNGNTLITLGILSIYRGGWVVYILLHI